MPVISFPDDSVSDFEIDFFHPRQIALAASEVFNKHKEIVQSDVFRNRLPVFRYVLNLCFFFQFLIQHPFFLPPAEHTAHTPTCPGHCHRVYPDPKLLRPSERGILLCFSPVPVESFPAYSNSGLSSISAHVF